MTDYAMKKINRRLFVIDKDDNLVYSMPDYLKGLLRDRNEFQSKVVNRLNRGDRYIEVITDFQRELWDRRLIKTHPWMFKED